LPCARLKDNPDLYFRESTLNLESVVIRIKVYIGSKIRIWNAGPGAEHVALPPQFLRRYPGCREENQLG